MWRLTRVAETGSTNADVAGLARDGAPEGTALVADHQVAGRGRLDRAWETPAGSSLTVSFLLRPVEVPAARWPWLPLMVGVAAVDALARLTTVDAVLKWPNDVLVDDRKLAGILVERVDTPQGPAVVAGIGINVTQTEDQLPSGAVSLAVEGAVVTPDEVLGVLCEELAARYAAWRSVGGNAESPAVGGSAEPRSAGDGSGAGLAGAYRERCATLGRRVRAELPGGDAIEGSATGVDGMGRLIVQSERGEVAVGAGDIVHLRAVSESDRPSR